MITSLKDRINAYKEISDIKLLPKLPVIVQINGRSFSKITSLLQKPFSDDFSKCIGTVLYNLVYEVEGCIFGFSFADKIFLVLRNDTTHETEPWYDNKIQKISSVTASLTTSYFIKCSKEFNLDLFGSPIFLSECFVVPNISEAINFIICKQQEAMYSAVGWSSFYELIKLFDVDSVKRILNGTSFKEKIEILHERTGIDFNTYPPVFINGLACYKVPKIISGESFKNKWTIDENLPIFSKDRTLLENVFKSGRDIFRVNRDI